MAGKPRKRGAELAAIAAESQDAPPTRPAPGLEVFADFGRTNFATFAKANLALSQGLGAIGDELFDYAKASLASASETAAALLGAKTLDEVIELNSGLAKHAVEAMIARSGRLGELGVATTKATLASFAREG